MQKLLTNTARSLGVIGIMILLALLLSGFYLLDKVYHKVEKWRYR